MNSFGWYTCSTYSTWELKNDSIHLYYNFSEYEQLNGASPYTKTPDSTLLSHFFGGSIFLQIKTIFGSKKVIPNYVEAYGYDKNGLNLTHDYYSKDYPYRWIKLKYSMALTDTLLFKNSVFCDNELFESRFGVSIPFIL